MYFPQKEMQSLFQQYSSAESNQLDYRKFTGELYGEKSLKVAHIQKPESNKAA